MSRQKEFNLYVNEKKGTVVSVVKSTAADAIDQSMEIIGENIAISPAKLVTLGVIPNSFSGKAKCNFDDGDEFDPSKGKELSHDRMMAKYHASTAKGMNRIAAYLESEAKRIREAADKHVEISEELKNSAYSEWN